MIATKSQATLRSLLLKHTQERHNLAEERFERLHVFTSAVSDAQWVQAMFWLHQRYQHTITTAASAVLLKPVADVLTHALQTAVEQLCSVLNCIKPGNNPLALHTTKRLDEISGTLYNFKGSGMGARILYRRAIQHKTQPTNFLDEAQTLSQGRWRVVVKAINEPSENSDIFYVRCVNAAKNVFADLDLSLSAAERSFAHSIRDRI